MILHGKISAPDLICGGTPCQAFSLAGLTNVLTVKGGRIRRLSPLETERLMGFPDHYTNLSDTKKTNRYQAVGNAWAVPVIKWIGQRLFSKSCKHLRLQEEDSAFSSRVTKIEENCFFFNFGKDIVPFRNGSSLNCTAIPEECSFATMKDIVSPDAPKDIYISPVGCYGIIRRKTERNLKINPRLEEVLLSIASEMSPKEIEKRSRIQHRGRFSAPFSVDATDDAQCFCQHNKFCDNM